MKGPIETIIIRVQQNFEIAGGLNPVQREIEDDRIINPLKNIKVLYEINAVGIIISSIHKKTIQN